MVKSIRFWLQAAGLTSEPRAGRRVQTLTQLGQIIMNNDPYFEDLFSLYVVHANIASNRRLTTAWYLLFNAFDAQRFTRTTMEDHLLTTFKELVNVGFQKPHLGMTVLLL